MLAESFNDALIDCVRACGGSKVVGLALWPAKGIEAAQRQLLASLNPDRAEKLGPDELLLVLHMARVRGCHAGMQYLCEALSYADPVPIEPRDEVAEVQRQFIEASKQIAKLAERIERLQQGPGLRAA